jgi:hypothetical protein
MGLILHAVSSWQVVKTQSCDFLQRPHISDWVSSLKWLLLLYLHWIYKRCVGDSNTVYWLRGIRISLSRFYFSADGEKFRSVEADILVILRCPLPVHIQYKPVYWKITFIFVSFLHCIWDLYVFCLFYTWFVKSFVLFISVSSVFS